MPSLGFIAPPKILGPPLDTKAPGPPLIYLVGPLAISDPQVSHRCCKHGGRWLLKI